MIHRLSLSIVLSMLFVGTVSAQDERGAAEPITRGDPRLSENQIAPILEGLGDLHFEVTTKTDATQLFINQGLSLAYAFNHAESLRAFKEAARREPDCAMAYWGQALALGPNINRPMTAEAAPKALAAIQKAVSLKSNTSPGERALIEAMAVRFSDDDSVARRDLNVTYAAAMKDLIAAFPNDMDAATLYVSALMNLSPWNYWTKDGQPRARTSDIVSTLESILETDPEHIGAIHYYIHAVEASQQPERAVAPAEKLGALAPGAGHLVHMPSHIFVRVGRYADASASNAAAIKADVQYIAQCSAQGIYPLRYYPHNIHFFAWSASIEGRSKDAIAAAKDVAMQALPANVDDQTTRLRSQDFTVMPLYAMLRFGKWDDIMAYPEPDEDLLYLRGVWHYARGTALLARGELRKTRAELKALDGILNETAIDDVAIRRGQATTFLTIAKEILQGEVAAKRGKYDDAVRNLDRAVRLQDGLRYSEPPGWYYPVRQSLGAVLIDAGRADEAETVYWEDLRQHPENGWSLYGLTQALERQKKTQMAEEVAARFDRAWSNADVTIEASRILD